jgi:iron(III) transport system permease protein
VQLGAWRWPALGLCAAVAGLALALPLGTILFWLARAIATGEPVRLVLDAAANSVLVSALTAAIAVCVGLPVAVLAARHPHPISLLLERATYLGYALPGIVVALALVFIGANYLPWLYQTLPMLVLAYLVRFVPQAIGSARAALLLVSPRLEEAARTLGRSHWRAVGEVVVPAIRPGLLAGAALVFLTTMKELPATLLLAPIGFDTLATRIWSATAEGFFARAAGPALLMIGVSLVSLAVLLRVDDRSG